MKEGSKVKATSKGKSEIEWLTEVKEAFASDKSWRSSLVEKSWWINRSYYSGTQNIKYNEKNGQLVEDTTDPLRFQINLIYPAVRAVRAVLTRSNPVWDVDSYPYGTMNALEILYLNQFMASLYEKLDLKETIKEVIFYGLTCGLGIFQYGFDQDLDNKEGQIWVEALDPMDVYFGGRAATDMDNVERVTKVVVRSLGYMKRKEKEGVYKNTRNIGTSDRASESAYKEMLNMMTKSGNSGASKGDGLVLVKETWMKKGDKVMVVTWTDEAVHRVEKTTFKSLPFVLYKPDITPGQLYNEGWVKPLIPMQKAINYLQRKILQYNVSMAMGSWVTDQESGVKMISNESGQFIVKNRGSELTSITAQPLNSTPFNQLNDLYRQFQNISGVQEALLGRAPAGVTAAIAIESLVSNAVANFADLIDNLAISMSNLGECILDVAYQNYGVTKTVKVVDASGNESVVKVGGRDAKISDQEYVEGKAMRLPERAEVRVKVIEGTAYTRQGKQEILMNLRKMGLMDGRTVLSEFGFDADSILQKIAQEQQEAMMAQQPPMPEEVPGEMPQEVVEPVAPEMGVEGDRMALIEQFIAKLQEQGISLGGEFMNNEDLLIDVIEGVVPASVVDGVLTVQM